MAIERFDWLYGPTEGRWIELSDEGGFPATVSSLVPSRFSAYARIFHPLSFDHLRDVRWAEIAATNGRIPHRLMQITGILAPPSGEVNASDLLLGQVAVGMLPDRDRRALAAMLQRHTSSSQVVLAYWEGWGEFPESVLRGGGLELPNRRYYLAEVPIDLWVSGELPGHSFAPNIVWPRDRAWLVNTDIDLVSTYVGGSERAIAEIIRSPELETAMAHPDDGVQYWNDVVNHKIEPPTGRA